MLPSVSQLATRLIVPLGFSLGLLLLGILLLLAGRQRWAGLLLSIGFLWLWLCSTPFISRQLVAPLERSHPGIPAGERAAALVVLGGTLGAEAPPRASPDLGGGADRVLHTARLYRAGAAPLVIAAGGATQPSHLDVSEAERMAELLEEWGVPRSALRVETRSRNTHENCVEVEKILEAQGARDALLVTSAIHMRRALATCRTAGLSVRPAPTDYIVTDRPIWLLDWLPDAGALQATGRAIKELVGYEAYRLRGWIDSDAIGPTPSPDC